MGGYSYQGHGQPSWTYLIPIVFVAIAILRNIRARNLRIERLWIGPVLILTATALTLSHQKPPTPVMLAVDVAAVAVGAALGWWRGRFTRITVDRESHRLTSQTSPVGMLLILGIFALRYGLRTWAATHSEILHASVTEITDATLLLAVGLVCTQRLRWRYGRRVF